MVLETRSARHVVLTGGIGSGKSSVGRLLEGWGAHVVDADVLAREVVAPGTSGLAAVIAAFGPKILGADGALDRAALADLVFAKPEELARLEAIVHPLVHAAALEEIEANAGAELLVYEVPLPGRNPFAGAPSVVVVDAPEQVRRARLRARGLRDHQIDARMASQPTRAAWQVLATEVIDNSGTEAELAHLVGRLWLRLTGRTARVGTDS